MWSYLNLIPDKHNLIVADSSFFICFLEDIKRPDILIFFLNKFEFAFGDKVYSEINRCEHYNLIKDNEHLNLISDLNFSEILRPFFSKYENIKGEGEIIALAVVLYGLKRINRLIIDDDEPRHFVERNLPHLVGIMTGTVGFVGKCCYEMHILEKDQSLQIIYEIEKSPFRVSSKVLSDVRSFLG